MTADQQKTIAAVHEANARHGYCVATDVAHLLGISRDAAYRRLARLAARGHLAKTATTWPQTSVAVTYWRVVS